MVLSVYAQALRASGTLPPPSPRWPRRCMHARQNTRSSRLSIDRGRHTCSRGHSPWMALRMKCWGAPRADTHVCCSPALAPFSLTYNCAQCSIQHFACQLEAICALAWPRVSCRFMPWKVNGHAARAGPPCGRSVSQTKRKTPDKSDSSRAGAHLARVPPKAVLSRPALFEGLFQRCELHSLRTSIRFSCRCECINHCPVLLLTSFSGA